MSLHFKRRCPFWEKQWLDTLFIFIYLFIFAVRGPLTAVASPAVEHRLRTRRLCGHGSRAQPLHSMWDLPRPGHEPMSPASAGGLSTTVPPGKPYTALFFIKLHQVYKPTLTSRLSYLHVLFSAGKMIPLLYVVPSYSPTESTLHSQSKCILPCTTITCLRLSVPAPWCFLPENGKKLACSGYS